MTKWAVQRQRAMDLGPLFDYLERRGVKQTWLAAQLRMTKQRLYRIRIGDLPAPEGFLDIACAVLGISVDDLTGTPRATRARRKSA